MIASSSTSESASVEAAAAGTSSTTTSVPELTSSQNVTSSSSTSNADHLRRELNLLKVQLKQRDAELQRIKHRVETAKSIPTIDNDAAVALVNDVQQLRYDEADLRTKLEDVTKVCDGVLKNVHSASRSSESSRVNAVINRYNEQLQDLTRQLFVAQQDNSRLRAERIDYEAKISAIIHENAFLKSENEYLQDEVNELKRRCNEQHKTAKMLQAEIADLKRTYQTELVTTKEHLIDNHQSLLDQRLYEIESLRSELADRHKEHQRCLLRAQSNCSYLERERDRYEKFAHELSQSLHALTTDNQHLLSQLSMMKQSTAEEQIKIAQRFDRMISERNNLTQKLNILQANNRRSPSVIDPTNVDDDHVSVGNALTAVAVEERLETAHATITCLTQQVRELKAVNQYTHSPQSELLKMLKEKCVELVEVEQTLKSIESRCQRLIEERCNTTLLLVEMSKDMRTLLDAQRQLCLRADSS